MLWGSFWAWRVLQELGRTTRMQQGNTRKKLLQRKAFTLVELIVVIAIMAILAGLLMSAVVGALEEGRRVTCSSRLHQIGIAFEMYLADYDHVYPWADDPVSTDPYYWFWMGRGWRSAVEPYIDENLRVLYCPSDPTDPETWESTSYAYSMAFYHSPEQIDQMTSAADTYSNPQRTVPQKAGRARHPTRKVMVAEWLSNHSHVTDDAGWWSWEGTRNCLFVDGHIGYIEASNVLPANDELPDFNLTINGMRGQDID